MQCSACSHDNRPGRKFCVNCGASLERRCPQCNAVCEPDEKFCGECGAEITGLGIKGLAARGKTEPITPNPLSYTPKHLADKILQSKSALEGERKQVTVCSATWSARRRSRNSSTPRSGATSLCSITRPRPAPSGASAATATPRSFSAGGKTGWRDDLDPFAWQIGRQSASAWMAPTERRTFGGVVPLCLVRGFGLYLPRRCGLEGQDPLLDYRHALLAASPEQAMRQQLHPLAERRVLLVEPIDLVAEFVEDCLGLCSARHHHHRERL